jgi:hypothetical protein
MIFRVTMHACCSLSIDTSARLCLTVAVTHLSLFPSMWVVSFVSTALPVRLSMVTAHEQNNDCI